MLRTQEGERFEQVWQVVTVEIAETGAFAAGALAGERNEGRRGLDLLVRHGEALREGVRDGVPIALGYLAVSFSLGIAARKAGLDAVQAFFASLFNNASAGEYAGFAVIGAGGSLLEMAVVMLVANARYLLMSCSMAQRFSPRTPLIHRVLVGFDLTDELFGISIARPGEADPYYSYGAMVVALARPQSQLSRQEMTVEGIDVVLAMDISGSMLAEDFKPNRLEAAKKVAADFIEGRKNDRMGLVVFAGEAFTQVPLTIDHQVLLKQLGAVKSGLVRDGTALGDGLATAINRIKDSQAESKVIILLTDGVNNQGSVDPLSAAEIAALYNIRLYTIGVGARGKAPFPFRDQFGRVHYQNIDVEIDEDLMKQMASATGDGQYFRATNRKALQEIFDQIDEMETSKIDVTQYAQTRDEHQPWLWLAAIALLLEALLRYVWLKR